MVVSDTPGRSRGPAVRLPRRGRPPGEVLAEMRGARRHDADWRRGRTWNLVYFAGDELLEFAKEAYTEYFSENGLNPGAFPSLRRFESEVVAMAAGLLGGDSQVVGNITSGGTESLLLAVKTARDRARAEHPEVTAPEMVVPVSAHPGLLKGAHYFGLKAVRVPVGPDFGADVEATRRALTPNTVLIAGSAPSYPQGVVDPIRELAALAAERAISFHVDACLGGFFLPFARALGRPVPDFDFSVPGVTSLSADIHKYGFAAKGASLILHRNRQLRRHQYFTVIDWPGGLFGSPTMTGTRPGGAIAAAWAVMNRVGEDGYLELARAILETTRVLIEGIDRIPGLHVLGRPAMGVFAFGADPARFDVYAVAGLMEEKGWRLGRQQSPPCLHLIVTPTHGPVTGEFLADLREAAKAAEAPAMAARGPEPAGDRASDGEAATPGAMAGSRVDAGAPGGGTAAMYGATTKLPGPGERTTPDDLIAEVLDGWTRLGPGGRGD